MANRYNGLRIPKEELERLYNAGKTQFEIGEVYGVNQQAVQKWFKKLGIKARTAKRRNQNGDKNDSWKGDKASYSAFHYRVQAKRGKPSLCAMCETKKAKRFEWANMTGDYADVYDYVRLCKSCHSRFDDIHSNLTKNS